LISPEMIGAIWPIVLTGIFGVIAYWYQKYVDRKSALIELRRATYSKYLALIARHATDKSDKTNIELNQIYLELSVIASDDVVRAIGSFHDLSLGREIKNPNSARIEDRLAATILLMRKDCFEKTNLTAAEIISVTPLVEKKK
jgi:hypothetical protein